MDEIQSDTQPSMMDYAFDAITHLRVYYRLLLWILLAGLVLLVVMYATATPKFTATATIGPPNPSPATSMIATMGSGGNAAKRLLGGALGGGSNNDPFQEFKQLLQSPNIVVVLANDDEFLSKIFFKKWDYEKHQWKKPGSLSNVINTVKKFLQRPVYDHPGPIDLDRYLEKNFSLDISSSIGNSPMMNVAALSGGYIDVSISADDPRKAEYLLSTILNKADSLIRQQQLRDVEARIRYIEAELPKVTNAEQKGALIDVMGTQEEIKVMLVSDERFAFVVVSPAYASDRPVSPPSFLKSGLILVVFSLLLYGMMIVAGPHVEVIAKILNRFKRKS